jgi:hypothetical protein
VSGDRDSGREALVRALVLAELPEQLVSIPARHFDIADHHVERACLRLRQSGSRAVGDEHASACGRQGFACDRPGVLVIIDDQHEESIQADECGVTHARG